MTPGQQIRRLRQQRSLTQRQLAENVSVLTGQVPPLSAQSVSEWERGDSRPTLENARAVDEALAANGEVVDAFGFSPSDGPSLAEIQTQLGEVLALLHGLGAVLVRLAAAELDLTDQEAEQLLQSIGGPPPP